MEHHIFESQILGLFAILCFGCHDLPNAHAEQRELSINEVIRYELNDKNNISVRAILNGEHNITLMFPTAVTYVS